MIWPQGRVRQHADKETDRLTGGRQVRGERYNLLSVPSTRILLIQGTRPLQLVAFARRLHFSIHL
jgi:hypothetical protein